MLPAILSTLLVIIVASALSRRTALVRTLSGVDLTSRSGWWTGAARADPDDTGLRANRRLIALTGAVLLPLAVLVLLTGFFFDQLWGAHFFVGYLMLPAVLVKLGSTLYRMVRYYLRSGLYRYVRPPYPFARFTSAMLFIAVVVLFVSGIVMGVTGRQDAPWNLMHPFAASAFSSIIILHLCMYLPEALRTVGEDAHPKPPAAPSQRGRRLALLCAGALAGLLLGMASLALSQYPARAEGVQPPGSGSIAVQDRA
jgi:hypothetical protein